MSDYVNLRSLSPESQYALTERYAYQRQLDSWLRPLIEPQWCAYLIVLLKQEPDTAALFPKGKWATIQVLETLLQQAIINDRLDAMDGNNHAIERGG